MGDMMLFSIVVHLATVSCCFEDNNRRREKFRTVGWVEDARSEGTHHNSHGEGGFLSFKPHRDESAGADKQRISAQSEHDTTQQHCWIRLVLRANGNDQDAQQTHQGEDGEGAVQPESNDHFSTDDRQNTVGSSVHGVKNIV